MRRQSFVIGAPGLLPHPNPLPLGEGVSPDRRHASVLRESLCRSVWQCALSGTTARPKVSVYALERRVHTKTWAYRHTPLRCRVPRLLRTHAEVLEARVRADANPPLRRLAHRIEIAE